MSEELIYVRANVRKWDSLEVSVVGWQQSIKLSDDGSFKSSGFLEVYDSIEDFKATYPDEDPIVMAITPMEKKKYNYSLNYSYKFMKVPAEKHSCPNCDIPR